MVPLRASRPEAETPSLESGAPETPGGFADWVRPFLLPMTRLAARLAAGNDPDDIVQDALVRAWSKRQQFDPQRGSPAAWLLAITADQARQARRRRRWGPIPIDVGGGPRATDDALDVEAALARLPARQRLAIDCFYFAGLSVAETASVMRCSEGTVKSTLSDARHRLRSHLEVNDG